MSAGLVLGSIDSPRSRVIFLITGDPVLSNSDCYINVVDILAAAK